VYPDILKLQFPRMAAVAADTDHDGLVLNGLAVSPFSILGTAFGAFGHRVTRSNPCIQGIFFPLLIKIWEAKNYSLPIPGITG